MRHILPARDRRALGLLLGLGLMGLASADARAGRIEDRADGTTVIHVEVYELPDATRTDTFSRAEVAGVRRFQQRFPEIFAERYRARYRADPGRYGRHNWDRVEVVLHRFAGIQVRGVEVDLLAIAGGTAPDVLYLNFRKSDNYVRSGFLYRLDKPEDGYLAAMSPEEIAFRINPKLWPVIRRRGPDGETGSWALPYGGALGKVLMYRKDLFDAQRIPYPDADWTWDDMIHAARRLTDPDRGVYGMLLTRSKHEAFYWINFLWSAGGEVMEYDEATDQWTCVFDSRAGALALDFYTRLGAERWIDDRGKVRRGYSSKDTEAAAVMGKWERGEIGMYLTYIDEKVYATINPELTGMAPIPRGPTGLRGGELNSRMMGLFSGIAEPAVRDAAWEYMRFYDCREAMEVKTRVMVEGGLGPFVNPRYLRMFGYESLVRLAPREWEKTFEEAIASGRPEPYGRNSNLVYDLMTIPLRQAEQLAREDQLPDDEGERLDVLQALLRRGCARANREMIGVVSPGERRMRRAVAAGVLAAIVVTFALVFRRIARIFVAPEQTPDRAGRGWNVRRYGWAYLLLAPAVGSILLWQYLPLLRGSWMAFFDYQLIGRSAWVGIDNFGDVLFDGFWWRSVWNALRYSFLIMALTFLPPIVLAILLQEVPRGRLLFRTVYYLPAVMTGLVTVLLWKQFYEPSERGAVNALIMKVPAAGFIGVGLLLLWIGLLFARRLRLHDLKWPARGFAAVGLLLFVTLGGMAAPILFRPGEPLLDALIRAPARLLDVTPEPYHWLGDADIAMLACVIPMVWAGMGPGCLIYLAALKGIPDDYYEAADIDGATFIDKILFVVFPTLKALVIINFVGVFIGSWYNATGNILVMTAGAAETEVAGLHIWYKAFTFLKFGPATAMAWMLGFLLIGFTVHQLRILARVEFRAGDRA